MAFMTISKTNIFKEKTSWWGILTMSVILIFGTWVAMANDWFPVLDYVNLIFHEAGHWIWAVFGEMMKMLGGSLNQVLIPLICLVVFIWQKRWTGAVFSLWWTGQNLTNVSVYIRDAWDKALPLLGGDNVIHDWNWILGMWGMRDQAEMIADWVWWIGVVLMVGASLTGLILAWVIYNQQKNKK